MIDFIIEIIKIPFMVMRSIVITEYMGVEINCLQVAVCFALISLFLIAFVRVPNTGGGRE